MKDISHAKFNLITSQFDNYQKKYYAKTTSATEWISIIIENEIIDFRLNLNSLNHSHDPVSIHRLRVSLRRLRCLISFLKKITADNNLKQLSQYAKSIANTLGPVREIDVFKEFLISFLHKNKIKYFNNTLLLSKLDYYRNKEIISTISKLKIIQIDNFIEEIKNYISNTRSRNVLIDPHEPKLKIFIKKLLNKLVKKSLNFKLRKKPLPNKKLHKLRISLKKLRYACEFFGNLLSYKKNKKLILYLRIIQDLLGLKNDTTATSRVLELIIKKDDDIFNESLYIQKYSDQFSYELDIKIYRALKRLKKKKFFWRH